MRLVVMGTGPFAVPTADKLRQSGHSIELVVTRPVISNDGRKPPDSPMLDWARRHSLPVFQPTSVNEPESIERLRQIHADLFFVCDYGQILSRECLSASTLGGINLHGSLLPRHRGAAPIQWTILAGDATAGVSVIHMTPKLDAGPVLATARTEIAMDENAGQLESRLAELGVSATLEAIEILRTWNGSTPIGSPQSAQLASKAPRLAKKDGQLDFRHSAEYLVRLVRALQPWPGTFAELQFESGRNQRILIRSARALSQSSSAVGGLSGQADNRPGAIWSSTAPQLQLDWQVPWDRLIAIQCDRSLMLVSRLQPAGKREMSAEEFLRGHQIQPSDSFLLPASVCRILA